jgi:hypothetical protein
MDIGPVVPPGADDQQPLQLSPTDIAQCIRLEQCERYLRLRLYQRNVSSSVIEDYGVTTQSIPALLTRSGARFEALVEEAVTERFWKINFVEDLAHGGRRQDDNQRVVEIATGLGPNEPVFLFQPRLEGGTRRIVRGCPFPSPRECCWR